MKRWCCKIAVIPVCQLTSDLSCGDKRKLNGCSKSSHEDVWEVLESPSSEVFKTGEGNKVIKVS